ncbi:EthD domain-containing protein [Variovorax sp. J31P207]|uniref:EthD domain-containing protein n=1 Tax=Variovorax sp. J31P207 TaxID=3053510 RepID=UPI002576D766|nr:EthD domain-containing protein [Variovorax sp. J31P207]MDM0071510.1 EthD domain-containing protein [Variovorax sp. J31P207]
MHTIGFLFSRHPDMSLDEFHRHYRDVHGPIARQLPGLIEYRQHPVRETGVGDVHSHSGCGFDALSIFVFESAEAAEAAWNSPQNGPVQEDTVKMINLDTMITLPIVLRPVLTALEVPR